MAIVSETAMTAKYSTARQDALAHGISLIFSSRHAQAGMIKDLVDHEIAGCFGDALLFIRAEGSKDAAGVIRECDIHGEFHDVIALVRSEMERVRDEIERGSSKPALREYLKGCKYSLAYVRVVAQTEKLVKRYIKKYVRVVSDCPQWQEQLRSNTYDLVKKVDVFLDRFTELWNIEQAYGFPDRKCRTECWLIAYHGAFRVHYLLRKHLPKELFEYMVLRLRCKLVYVHVRALTRKRKRVKRCRCAE